MIVRKSLVRRQGVDKLADLVLGRVEVRAGSQPAEAGGDDDLEFVAQMFSHGVVVMLIR